MLNLSSAAPQSRTSLVDGGKSKVSHTQLITPYLTVVDKVTVGPYTTEHTDQGQPGKGFN